jgi:ribosome biogenesis GTPase A
MYFTDDESKNYRITFLKDLARVSKTAKWKDYLKFIADNLSGDMTSFSAENVNKIDDIIKQVDEKHESETTTS